MTNLKISDRMALALGAFLLFGLVIASGSSAPAASAPQPSPGLEVQNTPLVPTASAATLSTTSSQRIIKALTIADVVPAQGKLIAADLVGMELYLYQDGALVTQYPILTKGRPGTPYETPSGMYSVLSKEKNHFNYAEGINMPYSMQFNGNYFIHGWPTYADGSPVASTYSGGCIRLSSDNAAQVYAFAQVGTKVFVYDPGAAAVMPTLSLTNVAPEIDASAYLVADIDTGDVYAESNAQRAQPIGAITTLMTALVANETIMFDRSLHVSTPDITGSFVVGDLLYPLLMQQDSAIADSLSNYYGAHAFVSWMNGQAQALDMSATSFVDTTGASSDTATPDDLYRLAYYLANKKSFILKITRTPQKTIWSAGGDSYALTNVDALDAQPSFLGGMASTDSMLAVFSTKVSGEERRVAVVALGSSDPSAAVMRLFNWFSAAATLTQNAACASCALPHYRKIKL